MLFKISKITSLVSLFIILPVQIEGRSYVNMNCYDLWYARNAFFADRGYCFESPRTIKIFGKRCYPPYGRLNGYEKEQVDKIKYWERHKGCNNEYTHSTYTPSTNSYRNNPYARVSGIQWNDTLAVRTGPSTRYRRIGDLPPDATGVEILECTRKWCRVRYGNLIGWSYAKYLRSY
jgi:hypothetical protein